MQVRQLKIGSKYGYQRTAKPDDLDLVPVTVTSEPRRAQIKVRYEAGELEGLEEWVKGRQILCLWSERAAFLKDAQKRDRFDREDMRIFDPVVEEAISTVMTASGEESGFMQQWTTDEASAQRFWLRADLEGRAIDFGPVNYVDRHEAWWLSFATAEHLCQAYAAKEPDAVERYISAFEQELIAEGDEPGLRHQHEVLRALSPAFAVARSWMQQSVRSAQEKEIERLRGGQQAIRELEKAAPGSRRPASAERWPGLNASGLSY